MSPPKLSPSERQAAIDDVAKIHKKAYLTSAGVLFGAAILCVIARFAIRFHRRRSPRWDDILVLLAASCLVAGFGINLRLLDTLYLVEAMNKTIIVPTGAELARIFDVLKWAAIFAAMNWSAVYLVKFAFFNFFHILIFNMPKKITRFFWFSVAFTIICWLYTVVTTIIMCPHFGKDAVKCGLDPNQHVKALSNNILVNCVDIITDFFIISLPLIVVRQAIMPLSRKVSLASMLCLSIAMIICSVVRLVGTITDTQPDGTGSAPVWSIYWGLVEGCIALIMTSVIAIRGVFLNSQNEKPEGTREGTLSRFGRQLVFPFRLFSYSQGNGPNPPQSGRQEIPSDTSKMPSQVLTRATLSGVKKFIGGQRHGSESQDDVLRSVDRTYALEELDYHQYQRQQASISNRA
ncbi:hypothetical protein HJFPF1_07221 [Paramyrothecium foliicola]|nr:hypothetical protein HJFPF1_07221 [Paramyrothecium foliicola]